MYISLAILFITPLFSSLLIYFIPSLNQKIYKPLLVFGGSFLFSLMLVHMIPELFSQTTHSHHSTTTHSHHSTGLYLLLGFFLQIFLDFFSKGIAHGHSDITHQDKTQEIIKPLTLLIALCLHAFLDGVLLGSFTEKTPITHEIPHTLIGIILHKIPTSFTLTIILYRMNLTRTTILSYLLLFAATSPIGWILTHYLQTYSICPPHLLHFIRSIATGSLLHIATTILFESSPEHHFNIKKLIAILAGGIIATLV